MSKINQISKCFWNILYYHVTYCISQKSSVIPDVVYKVLYAILTGYNTGNRSLKKVNTYSLNPYENYCKGSNIF